MELCSKPEYEDLKGKVDTKLYDYHVRQAQSANVQQPPRPATVLAHLNTALSYEPARQQEFRAMVDAARQQLLEKSKVYVGVTFDDSSPNRTCGGIAAQLAQFGFGTLTSSASGVSILAPGEAGNLMQRRGNSQAQWVVVSGRVNACGINRGLKDGEQENATSNRWTDDKKTQQVPYTYFRQPHNLSAQLDVTYEVVDSASSLRQQSRGGCPG